MDALKPQPTEAQVSSTEKEKLLDFLNRFSGFRRQGEDGTQWDLRHAQYPEALANMPDPDAKQLWESIQAQMTTTGRDEHPQGNAPQFLEQFLDTAVKGLQAKTIGTVEMPLS